MLQYIIRSGKRDEIAAQCNEALEAGCRWIEIKAPKEFTDEELKSSIEQILPQIREKGASLILASRVTLAKQTGADGVQLYIDDMPPTAARMELEAGPIIGMSVRDVATVERNLHFDIDFFRLEPLFEEDGENLATLCEIANLLSEKKSDKPLAAAGGITSDNVEGVLAAGAEGVAVDSSIAEGHSSIKDGLENLIRTINQE